MELAKIQFCAPEEALKAEDFLQLTQQVWPGKYDLHKVHHALSKTINVSARHEGELVGCTRLLTDGYFFATVPEILVDPTYQRVGIGRRLMELIWELTPCTLSFGVQELNEGFFEKLGYHRQ